MIMPRKKDPVPVPPEELSAVEPVGFADRDKVDPGIQPVYVTGEAVGAIPNGTLVEKTKSDPDDPHQDGARAKVLGSIGPIDHPQYGRMYGYFVEWEDAPGIPTFVAAHRIRRI